MKHVPYIGAHTSIAGGLHLAFERSAAIGGNTLQIFAKSPRGRSIPMISDEDIQLACEARAHYKQVGGLIHSNYLANLSKPTEECQPDIRSIMHDFEIAHRTGFDAVNIHIGKQKGYATRDEAFAQMQRNVQIILQNNADKGYTPQFLFEITAGQGSELGTTIEEIGYFYQNYLRELPVKFCFDTAHAWGAGNDLANRDDLLVARDKHIGLDNLYCFHLNDAKVARGSHLDRHAPLGKGAIGWKTLIPIIQWAAAHDRHIYLETTEPERWPEEITWIQQIIAGNTDEVMRMHASDYQTELLKKFQDGGAQSLFG